jgi:hypothetical protein
LVVAVYRKKLFFLIILLRFDRLFFKLIIGAFVTDTFLRALAYAPLES